MNEHDQDHSSLLKTYGIQTAKVFLKKLNLLDTENQENSKPKTFFDTEIEQIEGVSASKSEDSGIQENKKIIAMSYAEKSPILFEEKPKHLKTPSIKIEPIVNSNTPNRKCNKQELPYFNNKEKSEANNQQNSKQIDIHKKNFGNSVQKETNSDNFVQKVENYVQKEDIKSINVNFKQSNVNFSYHCNQCNLNFERKLALKLHQKRIHKSKIHQTPKNSIYVDRTERINNQVDIIKNENVREVIEPETLTEFENKTPVGHSKPLASEDAKKSIMAENSLKAENYLRAKSPIRTEIPTKAQIDIMAEISAKAENFIKSSRPKMQHSCEICGKICLAPSKLKVHMRIHTGEKPYSCSYCTLKFREKGHINRHEKVHNTRGHEMKTEESEMIHFCKFCHKDLVGRQAFLNHGKLHKTLVNNKSKYFQVTRPRNKYACDICQKAVATPSKLIIHKRIHTGGKPHSCSYCTAKFSSMSTVRSHEKIHAAKGHKIKSEKSEMFHFCKFCRKDFVGRQAFLNHEKLHKKLVNNKSKYQQFTKPKNNYACEICQKAVATPSKLIIHRRIHTGEKPHSCKYCTLKFRQKIHKAVHEKIHVTKEHTVESDKSKMIHFCNYCNINKEFIGVEAYTVHMKNHSKLNDDKLAVEKEIKKHDILENHYEISENQNQTSENQNQTSGNQNKTSENQNEVYEEQNEISDDPVKREEEEKNPKCQVCNVYTMYNMSKYQFTHTLVKQKLNCSQHKNIQIVAKEQEIKPKEFEIHEDSLLEDIYEIKPETLIHQQINHGMFLEW